MSETDTTQSDLRKECVALVPKKIFSPIKTEVFLGGKNVSRFGCCDLVSVDHLAYSANDHHGGDLWWEVEVGGTLGKTGGQAESSKEPDAGARSSVFADSHDRNCQKGRQREGENEKKEKRLVFRGKYLKGSGKVPRSLARSGMTNLPYSHLGG